MFITHTYTKDRSANYLPNMATRQIFGLCTGQESWWGLIEMQAEYCEDLLGLYSWQEFILGGGAN